MSALAGTRRGRARSWATGVSLAFHALVLLLLGWSAAPHLGAPPRPAPPDILVSLASAPAPVAATHLAKPASPPPAAVPSPARPQAEAPVRPTPAAPSRPAASTAGAAPPAGPAAATDHPAPLPSAEAGGAVRGFLRGTVGCEHRDAVALTPAERERCDEVAGVRGRSGPQVDRIPPDKLLAFSAAAAAGEHRRAMREGPLPSPVVACEGSGSNLGLGCLPPEASHHIAIP